MSLIRWSSRLPNDKFSPFYVYLSKDRINVYLSNSEMDQDTFAHVIEKLYKECVERGLINE